MLGKLSYLWVESMQHCSLRRGPANISPQDHRGCHVPSQTSCRSPPSRSALFSWKTNHRRIGRFVSCCSGAPCPRSSPQDRVGILAWPLPALVRICVASVVASSSVPHAPRRLPRRHDFCPRGSTSVLTSLSLGRLELLVCHRTTLGEPTACRLPCPTVASCDLS